ncbi:MAG TPA: hypothetical protein VND87_16085, partial [Stellaceae bacterium]|nr:hypothetical protein [Stellaceae bacterium]
MLRNKQGCRPDRVEQNCRLAEALFHRGRRDDAIECARRAVALAAEHDEATLDFAAWLFSNCGYHDEAAHAYQRLITLRPGWIEGHRHASGSLAAIGALDPAVEHACTASDRAPNHREFALHAGGLLLEAGRPDAAIAYLRRAADLAPRDNRALQTLSAALFAAGQSEAALASALDAAALDPGDPPAAIHACELLMRCERLDEAAAIVTPPAAAGNPTALRVLSGVEAARGRDAAAIEAIERAIGMLPDRAEFHLHRGHVLHCLHCNDEAAAAFARAAELDETSRDARRGQFAALLAGGRLTQATAAGGGMLRDFPDDDDAAAAVLDLLNRRLDTIDGDYVLLGDRRLRPLPSPRPPPRLIDGVRCQCRVLHALILRETRTRFGEARLGYGWALIEPLLHLSLLWVMFALLMHGRPPMGSNFFLFYLTGLVPYHIFVHASCSMTHAVPSNGALLQLPRVTTFDVVLARGILEVATDMLVAVTLLLAFAAFGIASAPDNSWIVCVALLATAALGCGVGFLNAVIAVLCPSWERIWVQVTRILYFASGIF